VYHFGGQATLIAAALVGVLALISPETVVSLLLGGS
jgi:hypothetical protein